MKRLKLDLWAELETHPIIKKNHEEALPDTPLKKKLDERKEDEAEQFLSFKVSERIESERRLHPLLN